MPLDKAALIGCAVTTGTCAAINTARVPAGASLAIFGVGGIGLNAVQGRRLAGAFLLIAVDVADNKLEFARTLGATHTVNAAHADPIQAIRDLTAGRGAEFTVVAVGNTGAIQQAWDALERRRTWSQSRQGGGAGSTLGSRSATALSSTILA
jgi:Zn-dependent alcohol dehydrogenase